MTPASAALAAVVGAGVCVADEVVVGAAVVGAAVVGAPVVGAGVVGAAVVGAGVVGAAVVDVAVVGVADGVAVAEAVAEALTACRGSQDSLNPVAVAAIAVLVRAATAPPEAAVSRALPAIKVATLRRLCAIRVSNPY